MQKDEVLRLLRDPELIPSKKHSLIDQVAALAAELNISCYLVGGFVRDMLISYPINDLDVVFEGDAIQVGRELVRRFGGRLTTHEKFRTAVWLLPDSTGFLDLITARKETYPSPGLLPIVKPSTILDDLRRRDFPINAMAIRLDGEHFGELLDPLDGLRDLKSQIIRVVHEKSFLDDPTRIFRAVRYACRYGFTIDQNTNGMINSDSLQVLSRLSGERMRHELDLIFEEEKSAAMLGMLGELGLFPSIHPSLPLFNPDYVEFLDPPPIMEIPFSRKEAGFGLWLMDSSLDEIRSISIRLNFSNDLFDTVWAGMQLKRSLVVLLNSQPSIWTYALEKLPLLSIYLVYLVTNENGLLRYLSIWRHVKPQTTGADLKKLGLEAGPKFGEILTRLRAAWLDGEVGNADEEKELLRTLL